MKRRCGVVHDERSADMKKEIIRINSTKSCEIYRVGGALYCRSYDSIVGKFEDGVLTFGRNWRLSPTTSRHIYNFVTNLPLNNTLVNLKGRSVTDKIQSGIDIGVFRYDKNLKGW